MSDLSNTSDARVKVIEGGIQGLNEAVSPIANTIDRVATLEGKASSLELRTEALESDASIPRYTEGVISDGPTRTGGFYYNQADDTLKVYTGAGWKTIQFAS